MTPLAGSGDRHVTTPASVLHGREAAELVCVLLLTIPDVDLRSVCVSVSRRGVVLCCLDPEM